MSSSAFTPSTTTVTNNVPVNVPVVTAWEAYTPTFEGFGTPTSVSALWRRVGDNIQVTGNFTSGTPTSATATISLPSGLNLDSTKINGPGQTKILGFVMRANSTSTPFPANTRGPFVITESKNTSTSKVYLSFTANTLSGGVFEVAGGTNILASGELLTFEFNAPISQWSGSGTTTLATRAVEEYVSHDGTNIVRGPAGSLVPSVGFSTGVTQFIVDFQQALNATDSFVLEFSRSGLGWQNASDIYPWYAGNNASGANFYGLRIYKFNATQYAIEFGNQGIRVAISNQSAGAESWANERIAGTRFRLRKVSGGAQVGYPVSARNIVGDTSGSVVPVGMLGEKIDWNFGTSTTLISSSGMQNVGGASQGITLNRGTYLLTCTGTGTPGATNIRVQTQAIISSGSGTLTPIGGFSDSVLSMDSSGNTMQMHFSGYAVITQDSTVIKLQANPVGANLNGSIINRGAAIRIA